MILIECVNAYTAVQGLMDKEWDYRTAYALVTLKRKLFPHAAFYQQEEMKLVKELAEKDEKGNVIWDGDGRFRFAHPEDGAAFSRKRRELGLVEVQEDFGLLKVKRPGRITPAQLEALEGFLLFGEEEADEQTA